MKTLFELSKSGSKMGIAPELTVSEYNFEGEFLTSQQTQLPELDGIVLQKYYSDFLNEIQQKEYDLIEEIGLDYQPDMGEQLQNLSGFNGAHPLQKKRDIQGTAHLIYSLQEEVKGIMGAFYASLVAKSDENAQLIVLKMVKKYHKTNGSENRNQIVVCGDNALIGEHIAKNLGYELVRLKPDKNGFVSLQNLESALNEKVALVAVNVVNHLAQIDENATQIAKLIAESGALSYLCGEQFKPLFGIMRPIDLGFDLVTLNLGIFANGWDCGVCAVCASERTFEYLPAPLATRDRSGSFSLSVPEKSIGLSRTFSGNLNAMVRIHSYLAVLGRDGIRNLSECAILNANYLARTLEKVNAVKVGSCHDRFEFKSKNSNCANQKLKDGVIIKVSGTLSKEQLDDYANQIIQLQK